MMFRLYNLQIVPGVSGICQVSHILASILPAETMASPTPAQQGSKPVYVFVGGVSHTPEFFAGAIEILSEHGYRNNELAP